MRTTRITNTQQDVGRWKMEDSMHYLQCKAVALQKGNITQRTDFQKVHNRLRTAQMIYNIF